MSEPWKEDLEPPACGICEFWEPKHSNPEFGYCKRFPPFLTPHDDENPFRGAWPQTEFCDWCGEFKPEP